MSFNRRVPGIVAALFSVAFFIIAARLWQLQVLSGEELRAASERNRLRVSPIYAPRGIIYDRNGNPLVRNSPNFTVSLLPELAAEADVAGISLLLGIAPEEVVAKVASAKGSVEPIVLRGALEFDELARVEARLSDFPELIVDADVARDYPYGETAAHLIGYIGKLNEDQAKDPAYADVPYGGMVGQWGVEKLYDAHLRGTPGQRLIEVDALGRQLRVVGEVPPKKGKDLVLALDINTQMAAESGFGQRKGAMVALDPNTGEVLALVSRPAFDPNLFVHGISPDDWRRLAFGPDHPMLNRSFQSAYPPGSTFKIITEMAAIDSGSMTPSGSVNCGGGYYMGSRRFGCWKKEGHGPVDARKALAESCDVYFYNAGLKTGIDSIARYARAFGLGSRTGIGLGSEKAGLIPDTTWKAQKRKDRWYPGETLNASIGQGYVLVTPLQMARMIAAVGTGGKFVPQITLTRYTGGAVSGRKIPIDVRESTIALVKDGLYAVVNENGGTARWSANSAVVPISGKTGTAQVMSTTRGPDHAWFVAYAPSDSPEIAVSVLVEEGGHGASAAAPIARTAIETYIKGRQDADRPKDDTKL